MDEPKTDNERGSAWAFHVIEFIDEELEARGWDRWELARRMGGDAPHNVLSLEFLELQNPHCRLGDEGAKQLARAFGTGPEVWLNLEKSWLTFHKKMWAEVETPKGKGD